MEHAIHRCCLEAHEQTMGSLLRPASFFSLPPLWRSIFTDDTKAGSVELLGVVVYQPLR